MRSEEFAKKFGIPEEDSLFCGVGGLRDIVGIASRGVGKAGVARKDLGGSGIKENGREAIGGSLVGSGSAKSAADIF